MVRKLLITATVMVALLAAPAAAQYPDIVVQPQRTPPGGTVTVSGRGCQPGEEVVITPRRARPSQSQATDQWTGGKVVATTTAAADGSFTTSFKVPAHTPTGTYDVIAKCGDLVQTQQIEVLGTDVVAPTDSGTGATSGSLPRTGSNLNTVGLAGAVLLVVGGLFLLSSRKRRNAAEA